MSTEVDEIEGDVVMWPLKLVRFEGCHNVATEVDKYEQANNHILAATETLIVFSIYRYTVENKCSYKNFRENFKVCKSD